MQKILILARLTLFRLMSSLPRIGWAGGPPSYLQNWQIQKLQIFISISCYDAKNVQKKCAKYEDQSSIVKQFIPEQLIEKQSSIFKQFIPEQLIEEQRSIFKQLIPEQLIEDQGSIFKQLIPEQLIEEQRSIFKQFIPEQLIKQLSSIIC